MYKRIFENKGETVTIQFEGRTLEARAGESVAAAVLAANPGHTRRTPVQNAPRAPYCMMGGCFDCLMEIDGVANRQACMTTVTEGMKVRRQDGLRRLET